MDISTRLTQIFLAVLATSLYRKFRFDIAFARLAYPFQWIRDEDVEDLRGGGFRSANRTRYPLALTESAHFTGVTDGMKARQ
jgi:hypothetical protein